MSGPLLLLVAVASLAASFAGSAIARRALVRWRVVDVPNGRSSHRDPVPRGGGLAFVIVILLAWAGLALSGAPDLPWPMLAGAVAVAAVSMADDVRGVGWTVRLAIQALAVAAGGASLPAGQAILLPDLPPLLDRLIIGLAWLWFVNLFNFMDGINGIAATEAGVVGLGLAAIATVAGLAGWPLAPAVVVAAAVLGFLPYNVPVARMFMGDVGSATLGFVLGWLLILVATEGALATALLLPLYFLVDATSTLVLRALRGERLHEAHRRHAYQVAVDRGLPHTLVSGAVGGLGVVLAGLGYVALDRPLLALAVGLAITAGFILWLRGAFSSRRRTPMPD